MPPGIHTLTIIEPRGHHYEAALRLLNWKLNKKSRSNLTGPSYCTLYRYWTLNETLGAAVALAVADAAAAPTWYVPAVARFDRL